MASTTIAQVDKRVTEHDSILKEHGAKLQEHDYILNGAGDQPGIVKEFRDVKEIVKGMDTLWQQQKVWNRILGFVASALGISIIALIWSLITGAAILVKP